MPGNQPSKKANKAKKQNVGKKPAKKQNRAAATFTDGSRFIGMKDLVAHRVSWMTGSVYVGNGVIGANDAVFFRPLTGVNVVDALTGGGEVPVLGADPLIGVNYVRDIEQHYSRKRIRSLRLRLLSIQPSTQNSMVAVVAPVRGPGASGDTTVVTGAALTGPAYGNVVGMAGARSLPSYANGEFDLTPFIAGGSGADQNEFTINRDGDTAATQWGAGNIDLAGLAPAAFVIGGTNATAGLRGTNTHYVVVDMVVDYLDFIGGMNNPNPIAFLVSRGSLSLEEARTVLRILLSSGLKETKDMHFVHDLLKYTQKLT